MKTFTVRPLWWKGNRRSVIQSDLDLFTMHRETPGRLCFRPRNRHDRSQWRREPFWFTLRLCNEDTLFVEPGVSSDSNINLVLPHPHKSRLRPVDPFSTTNEAPTPFV